MEIFNRYKKYVLLAFVLIVLSIISIFYYKMENSEEEIETNIISNLETTTKVNINNDFYIDIKGAVKKPGVYLVHENDKVIDAINIAGGLSKNAVTSNINLSQKLKSEMVIYIFTKKELEKEEPKIITTTTACKCETIKVDNCIKTTTTSMPTTSAKIIDTKININTADVTMLTKLSGIGESKAKAIIEYRNANGYFKSIEDIKNVSGLGEALFDKIKNDITV